MVQSECLRGTWICIKTQLKHFKQLFLLAYEKKSNKDLNLGKKKIDNRSFQLYFS